LASCYQTKDCNQTPKKSLPSKRWNKKKTDKNLLGMVNYLAKFTPNLAETNAPMRNLLKKNSEFVWDCSQDTAFNHMKQLITSAGTLAYYDVTKEITLEVDASMSGLGAVLLQEGKPVACASKSHGRGLCPNKKRNVCNSIRH